MNITIDDLILIAGATLVIGTAVTIITLDIIDWYKKSNDKNNS